MLRFNNGITSAGAASDDLAPRPAARTKARRHGSGCWRRLPSVARSVRAARAVAAVRPRAAAGVPQRAVCGPRWALLPSAAGVIDPLLSTGFPLTLLGILRLVDVLDHDVGAARSGGGAVAVRADETLGELDATERLVAALYATMSDSALFKRLSLLYFAAASFSETARRLGRPERAPGFPAAQHSAFGPELRACTRRGSGETHRSGA